MKTLCLIMATILFAMMVCPAIAVAQQNKAQKLDHCSSQNPVPQEKQTLLCCCDQSAISILQVHAPYQISVVHVQTAEPATVPDFVFASDCNHLPYQKTGDLLSKLCVLRF
jgi:hypothetical protein